jgi:hypothetical protein
MKPEFPESIVECVVRFGAANTYPDYSREEAIRDLEDCADDLFEQRGLLPGEAHTHIIRRIETESPAFVVLPDCAAVFSQATLAGTTLAKPSRRMMRHIHARAARLESSI